MGRRAIFLAAGFLTCACACEGPKPPPAPPSARSPVRDPTSTLLRRAARLFDGRSLAGLGREEALDQLAEAEVVCLGETHLDQLTHDAELELLRVLADRRGGAVTLSMARLERDARPALDEFLAGRIGEAEFVARLRPWSSRNLRDPRG